MFQLTGFHDGARLCNGVKAGGDNGNIGLKMHLGSG